MSRKKPPSQQDLSRRERQIMDALFAMGSGSAGEIAQQLPDPPSDTAVRTLLRILEGKGHVRAAQQGRKKIYTPIQSKRRAANSAMQRLLRTFHEGSLETALAAFLADPNANITADELDRLARLIEQARQKGPVDDLTD